MYLIVGLGNPGKDYERTRHNAGFVVADKLAENLGIKINQLECDSLVGKGSFNSEQIIIAKPQTYMNRSGIAIKCLVGRYGVEANRIIVIYDDIDLPAGKIRLRPAGGSGGHKGVMSVIKELGTDEFGRIRIGIGRPPGGSVDVVEFVLSPFTDEEQKFMEFAFDQAVEAVKTVITRGYPIAMSLFNR